MQRSQHREALKQIPLCEGLHGRRRPYRDEYTGSLQNSEVNRRRARIVLRWGTAREVLRVLLALLVSFSIPGLRVGPLIYLRLPIHLGMEGEVHQIGKANCVATSCSTVSGVLWLYRQPR